ncbi:hypothetical protein [Pseudochelatococcus sp. G4_1912]|uniref:hypothetical protein n=1 Tax=Pseudochelatococcus sp. G4_1912 TaxID=3114288 RepID=UPI0039C743B5
MNKNSVQDIADLIFNVWKGIDVSSFVGDRQREVLRVAMNEEVSITLIFNDKMHFWVLIAEREVGHLSEHMRDRLIEALIDTTSHSRYDEGLTVGLTAEQKISVSKILVDVSVKQDIINSIQRLFSVIMGNRYENKIDSSYVIV